MFALRLKPLYLFLLLLVPAICGIILQHAPSWTNHNVLRLQVLGINCSTIFALTFALWLVMLTLALSPSVVMRFFVIGGLGLSMAFRGWQDSWMIDWLYLTRKIPDMSNGIDPSSVIFWMHVAVSAFVLIALFLLSRWLVSREKLAGKNKNSVFVTFLQFAVFPIGLWFLQPRVQKFSEKTEAN